LKDIVLTTFDSLSLSQPILSAVKAEGYETPTPIQAQAIPHLLAGRDLLGIAQTGTGKTAAFALPMLHLLMANDNRKPERGTARALMLSPDARTFAGRSPTASATYGRDLQADRAPRSLWRRLASARRPMRCAERRRHRRRHAGPPARPHQRRHCASPQVEIFVLDEADQMLDLGFMHDIRKLIRLLPKEAPEPVLLGHHAEGNRRRWRPSCCTIRARVEITPVATTAERVAQKVVICRSQGQQAQAAHRRCCRRSADSTRTLVFTRTKRGADKRGRSISQARASPLPPSTATRARASASARSGAFKNGKVPRARRDRHRGARHRRRRRQPRHQLRPAQRAGIYVHRIGRTARAGADGEAIAFCTPEDRGLLRDIERTIRQSVPVKEHELGIAGVAELAPMHGWDPTAKRKSGGGRHMPKAAKKPHHRGQGGEGRGSEGRGGKPRSDQPKREWNPVGMPTQSIDQSQFAKKTEAVARKPEGERLRHERPHADRSPAERQHTERPRAERPHGERPHGDRPHGERKASAKPGRGAPKGGKPFRGGKPGAQPARPQGGNSGNWMKSIGRGNTP
jgi:ATP-dependent RNA helicase RhlE